MLDSKEGVLLMHHDVAHLKIIFYNVFSKVLHSLSDVGVWDSLH